MGCNTRNLPLPLCLLWLDLARAGAPELPPSATAAQLSNRSAALHAAGRDREAYPIGERALELAESSGDARLTAICLMRVGLVLEAEGEFARAEPLFRRSLALLERTAGPDDLDTAVAANDLATLYCYTGRFAAAEQLERRALAVYEGSGRVSLLPGALGNLFLILSGQGKAAEGETYLRRALLLVEDTGPRSPAKAHLLVCEASLECSRRHFKRAAALLESALALQEQTLGPDHPAVARTLGCYSAVLARLRRKDEARRAESRAQAITRRNAFSPAE
jgi:tetratricopeptide (TPR) repeat protein